MKHIIIGFLGIIIGLWGIAVNWYMFLDLIKVLAPAALLVGGIIALMAGIGNFSAAGNNLPTTQNTQNTNVKSNP